MQGLALAAASGERWGEGFYVVKRLDAAGRRQTASHSCRALTKPEFGLMHARFFLRKA